MPLQPEWIMFYVVGGCGGLGVDCWLCYLLWDQMTKDQATYTLLNFGASRHFHYRNHEDNVLYCLTKSAGILVVRALGQ
jgi:hypothetical protein